jgi:hypothetical protein
LNQPSPAARAPAVARADTLVGAATLSARQWENPEPERDVLKSTPKYHEIVDLPLDITGARGHGSARRSRPDSPANTGFSSSGPRPRSDAIPLTRALAAVEHVRLARRTAKDADSLRRMSIIRRDAGDASELDVLLATSTPGRRRILLPQTRYHSFLLCSICRR